MTTALSAWGERTMFSLIEALNFRSLRYVRQPLGPFQVLVGPNASGKSNFLDVIAFLGRLILEGLESAVSERTDNFYDLLWGRSGNRFELAVEATIPEPLQNSRKHDAIRYELAIGIGENQVLSILNEQIRLRAAGGTTLNEIRGVRPQSLFSKLPGWTSEVISSGRQKVRMMAADQLVANESDVNEDGDSIWVSSGPKRSILSQLDADRFPELSWFAEALGRVCRLELVNTELRRPAAPGKGPDLGQDGSNLPWVVSRLQSSAPQAYGNWLAHIQTALPDVVGIRVVERPEDRHRYLMLQFAGDLEVPSWALSDGTLRLLALTLLAYQPDPQPSSSPVWLIEEPENSIHPTNIETVMQSLQSVYDGQILIATQSPILLAVVDPSKILVLARDEERGTTITAGDNHPALKHWRGEVSLGTLFAGGVLG